MASAIDAMNKAARELAEAVEPAAKQASRRAEPTPNAAAEAHRYYNDLSERGELVDVDERTDLLKLPPGVTHVRYPDGRVVRVSLESR